MGTATFTVSGTWVCPPGVTSINVQAWGGGGSGSGGTPSPSWIARGGGGGGAYAADTIAVTPGNSYTITVGTATGFTQFVGDNSATVKADGGSHGSNNNGGAGGSVANSIGATRFAGGAGGSTSDSASGSGGAGGGGGAGSTGNGNNGVTKSGENLGSAGGAAGTGTGSGTGGNGGNNGVAGLPGLTRGGGGGGGGSSASSGAGARGEMIITWTDTDGWWSANGVLDLATVKEYIELPVQGQLYVGGGMTGAWTVAIRTTWDGVVTATEEFLLDSEFGRFVTGINSVGVNGFFAGSWVEKGLYNTSDSVYFLVSNGTSIQAYRNNVAMGTAVTSSVDFANGGSTRWRSRYTSGSEFPWTNPVQRASVYNIALDSTQRQALYNAMMDINVTNKKAIFYRYQRMRS